MNPSISTESAKEFVSALVSITAVKATGTAKGDVLVNTLLRRYSNGIRLAAYIILWSVAMQHWCAKRCVTLLPELYGKENQDWYTTSASNSCSTIDMCYEASAGYSLIQMGYLFVKMHGNSSPGDASTIPRRTAEKTALCLHHHHTQA